MNKERLLYLIEQYLNNRASVEETRELESWYDSFGQLPDLNSIETPVSLFIEKTILHNPRT